MAVFALIAAAVAALWLWSQESSASSFSPNYSDGGGDFNSDALGGIDTSNTSPWTLDNLDNLTQAISDWETGHQNPNSLALRNNNPGALANGSGLLSFSDIGDGWDALSSFVQKTAAQHPDWSISEFMNFYVNGDSTKTAQNSQNDAAYVANYLGVDLSTKVASLLGYS
jgi:hypothetical protein